LQDANPRQPASWQARETFQSDLCLSQLPAKVSVKELTANEPLFALVERSKSPLFISYSIFVIFFLPGLLNYLTLKMYLESFYKINFCLSAS